MIIARQNEMLPLEMFTPPPTAGPDDTGGDEYGMSIVPFLSSFGEELVALFKSLDHGRKLVVMLSISDFYDQLEQNGWDEARDVSIRSAVEDFIRASCRKEDYFPMNGPVMAVATAFESYVKRALRLLIEVPYGRDYARGQKELKLPTKDLRKVSLGKALNAFRISQNHPDFEFARTFLTDDQLDQMDSFANARNSWAHRGVSTKILMSKVIDDARRDMVLGIEMIRWIGSTVIPALDSLLENDDAAKSSSNADYISLPESRDDRAPGIFISYSSADKKIADKIAKGLEAFDYDVWYDDWSIKPGDSIIQKINEGLASNDVLIVLLSPQSLKSRWVQMEVNSALVKKLQGESVWLIPIIIEECSPPPSVNDIHCIDMRRGTREGLTKLMVALRDIDKNVK
jgi:hypothetical protein